MKNTKLLLKLSLILLGVSSCGAKMPPITSCVFDQPRQVFRCVDNKGKEFDLYPIEDRSDKLICIPFNDFGVVLSYCKGLKGK